MSVSLRWSEVWRSALVELRLNKGVRLRSVVFLYRLATYRYRGISRALRWLLWPIAVLYKIYAEFLLGIELPAKARIGPGLRLYHGVGLVVHPSVCIGAHCILRQGVTIGNRSESDTCVPQIGDDVEFGAGATVVGPVRIGNNVVIGAGAVVTKDVPDDHTVLCAAARIWPIRENKVESEAS